MNSIEKKIKDQSKTITGYWSFEGFEQTARKNAANRSVKKWIKSMFGALGLNITKTAPISRPEEVNYIDDEGIIKKRNAKLAQYLCDYFGEYGLAIELNFCLNKVTEYDSIFRNQPIPDLGGGMGYNNGLILFLLAAVTNPQKVIESGVWRGYTTMLLDRATSDSAKLKCFDINLDRKVFHSNKAEYFEQDITEHEQSELNDIDLAFFDDHVSHYDRIMLCLTNDIRVVILDDDVALEQVHSDGWPAIPTASMVYNYQDIPHIFTWKRNGQSGKANIQGLDDKTVVESYNYIPFPPLNAFTGYRNTSYTTLLLRK